jgi:predicted AlkP superfamily pyrophosphatase or phosphodiesterase
MKNLLSIFLFSLPFGVISQQTPKILVSVVVDQMKYEFVDRFWEDFGDNGFKKLVNDGVFCRNTHYNYIPTYTGPGHASIYTGTTPSVHGIIGNNWYKKDDFSPVYCAGDWKSQTVCLCKKPHGKSNPGNGQMSPDALLCNTVGDQLKLKDSISKVFGVSIKDRGAILSTGALSDGAYWLNSESQWITSSFYRKNIPKWMVDFHENHPISSYLIGKWEGKTFSYDLNKKYAELGPSYIKSVPMGNDYTIDFTKQLFVNEKLGEDNHTDFLVICFSATDYVGHKFGPDSEEVKSTYQKLDKNIADLIQFLNQRVGIENYILSLTSDHGATTSIEDVEKNRLKGGLFSSKEMLVQLNKNLEIAFGVPEIIKRYANMQLYINYPIIDSLNILDNEVFLQTKKWFISQPYIDDIYNLRTLKNAFNTHKTQMLINGLHPKRSGDIFLTLSPGYIDWYTKTGTTHGSHYNYDAHVPLFFYGANIDAKQIYRNIKITDIAPTYSIIMKTAFPNACTGNPIGEIF